MVFNPTYYNCKQSELYTILGMAYASLTANLAAFTAFRGIYTAPFVAARIAAATAAEALPDFQARNAAAQLLRNDLQALNVTLLDQFQSLKRYITYAFPAVDWQIQWDAAGFSYLPSATNENWDSSAAMYLSMKNFITANSAALLAGLNMPAAFSGLITASKTAFDSAHSAFLSAEQAALTATETKVAANNACYTDMIAMFQDAKRLNFTPSVANQFVFSNLLQMISGGGLSGSTGVITDLVTGLPIPLAEISIASLGVSAFTDVTGTYTLAGIPAGTYTIDIVAPTPTTGGPYLPFTSVIVVISSTVSTNDFALAQ